MALATCKECGKKVSTKAKACPNCGAKPPPRTYSFTWFMAVLLAVYYVIFIGDDSQKLRSNTASNAPLSPEKEAEIKRKIEEERCKSSYEAFTQSKRYIKSRLKSPSTADFPFSVSSKGVRIRYIGDCTHRIWAYVDAQNSFGATIRTNYYVKIQNQKGTYTWKLLDATFLQ